MPNMLAVQIMGHLGRDPEMKTAGNSEVCEFSIAVNSPKRKDDPPTWFNISVWGKQGQNCERYLSKGSAVYVSGDLDIRPYTTRDGDEKISHDVRADKVQFLGGKSDSSGSSGGGYQRPGGGDGHDHAAGETGDDGIPF